MKKNIKVMSTSLTGNFRFRDKGIKIFERFLDKEYTDSVEQQISSDIKMSGINYNDIANKYPEITNILSKKTEYTTTIKDRRVINPFYESDAPFKSNCYSCSMAYDLRHRGFDVTAISDQYGGMTLEDIASCYDDSEFNSFDFSEASEVKKASEVMKNVLLEESNGEDSYGFITIDWRPFGGHIFNYEIKDGEVTYVDTQPSPGTYSDDQSINIEEYLSRSKFNMEPDAVEYMRTDNLYPNENITLTVTNRNEMLTDDINDNAELRDYEDVFYIVERILTMYEEGKRNVDESDDNILPIFEDTYIELDDAEEMIATYRKEYEELKNKISNKSKPAHGER